MYIGEKKITETRKTEEKTAGGIDIVEVLFSSGEREWLSELMYKASVSDTSCNASELRNKRMDALMGVVLGIMRDWGIKLNELPYFSAKLNQSLDFNTNNALIELWGAWMPKPNSPDEVDLVTVDRVLRAKKQTLKDVIGKS